MRPIALHGTAVAFALDTLFLFPTHARVDRLGASARAVDRWDGVLVALDQQGVLGLALRNVELAGAAVPEQELRAWRERAEAIREDGRRFRLTLERFLRAAAEAGVEPTLLKGASLDLDLYTDPAWRSRGDIDVLIEEAELESTLRAGAAAGLLLGRDAFPVWWYRWTHFHLKLVPSSRFLREVEVHWALHHASTLLTPDSGGMHARRVAVELAGCRAWTLEPLDRLLHLITHLVSHAGGMPGPPSRATLAAVLENPTNSIRLKWVLDIHAALERIGPSCPGESLAERARLWGAEAELAWALTCVRDGLGFARDLDRWVGGVIDAAGERPEPYTVARPKPGGPLPAFDFRARSLARLPRWIWPDRAYLRRRYGTRWGAVSRVSHAARAVGRILLSVLFLPFAWIGRAAAQPRRRRAFATATAPENVLDLASEWWALRSAPDESKPR